MSDEKVYTPEVIADQPFPSENEVISSSSSSSQTGVYSPTSIPDQPLPTKRIAVELLSTALNTKSRKIQKEFQFTEQGAIQVGKYENGVSGDIKISPAGIVARSSSGIETIAIDGETGDAVFSGTIQAGTVIGGAVAVGDGDIIIDGETKRMVFYDDNGVPQILIGNA